MRVEEEERADIPGPGADLSASQPYSAIQDYNINVLPRRNRTFFYGQFGYGYDVSNKLHLSTAVSYRLNNRSVVSPLIENDGGLAIEENRWRLSLRANYLFGR